MTRPERHSFVLLAAPPEPHACGGTLSEIEAWRAAGLPFVVASALAADSPGTVRLGLATPDKRRIGIRADVRALGTVMPPPGVTEAAAHAPEGWARTIGHVAETCAGADIEARVFGSLAWTCRTGRRFLHDGSDLDLLLTPGPRSDPARVLEAIADLLRAAGDHPRLDGELRLSGGAAANLRELAAGPSEILVKAHGGARLMPLDEVVRRIGGRA